MSEPTELDRRIEDLRALVRAALLAGDRERARALRRDLRAAEDAWHDAMAELDGASQARPPTPRPEPPHDTPKRSAVAELQLPLREQVHQALTLLTVPAGPKLISAVHEAMFSGAIPAARLTSMRRDEERSFRLAPLARPYYLCAALTADLLAPVRGLLAISTWPLERRIIGPLSPRVDYLTAAVQIAENVRRNPALRTIALRLLWRFAANIPGAAASWPPEPGDVATAANAELEVHADVDAKARRSAASRARRQLDEPAQLFGSRLRRHSRAEA